MACSDAEFSYVRALVHAETANLLALTRRPHLETQLRPLAVRAGLGSVEELITMLRTSTQTPLHRAVAETLTITETSFFRDASVFAALRDTVLPRLIEQNAATRRLRIWSAASSTGQEAYSVAMLLCERFPELSEWDVQILGTDLSRQVVEYARAGRYRRLEVNRGLPARMLVRYFSRDGDCWELSPEVRARCEFKQMNLCAPTSDLPVFDLVLLRNVLLYLAPCDRATVLRTAHRQLNSHGYLILGAAEQAEDSSDLFRAEFARDCYFYGPVAAG